MIKTDKINLISSLNKIRKKNKKIVLCHGVFDLVHLGHIKHFKSAKSYGDYLVVSITVDKFIKKVQEDHYLMKLKDLIFEPNQIN